MEMESYPIITTKSHFKCNDKIIYRLQTINYFLSLHLECDFVVILGYDLFCIQVEKLRE